MQYDFQTYLKMIGIGTAFFGAMDLFWLGFVANNFYKKYLGSIMRQDYFLAHKIAALIVWALIVVGCCLYVLPFVQNKSFKYVFMNGGIYGFIVYGVYNFTNYAVLQQYNVQLVLIDTIWGSFACAMVAVVLSYFI